MQEKFDFVGAVSESIYYRHDEDYTDNTTIIFIFFISYQVQRLRELLEKNCPAEFLSDGLDISSPPGHWKRAVGVSSFEYQ